eukprot:gnl/MRDRNA2_/MRDRNA2_14458_c0_seq1.p1 gnl/MRDRNA2_/MRDRNA2_14458_c0~~gnl/MRDRNA2_/MRDRNA2_14458_c0_seq1.p1  ORF type:complete len:140 (+),score=33.40 gnl/MRDRNA2_/MRDRNA2_14458_c0_seq1:186-605(+)
MKALSRQRTSSLSSSKFLIKSRQRESLELTSLSMREMHGNVILVTSQMNKQCIGSKIFKKHDIDESGKLDATELKTVLKEFNDGEEVSDIDCEWVLRKADILGDGHVTKIELQRALSMWYQKKNQNLAEEKASKVCAIL